MQKRKPTVVSEFKRVHDDIDSTLKDMMINDKGIVTVPSERIPIYKDIIDFIKADNNVEPLLVNKENIVEGIYNTIKAQAEDYDKTKMRLYIERYTT